jgi:hypothetical protein
MRSATCLQRYRAIRLRCKEIQQLSWTDPLAEGRCRFKIYLLLARYPQLIH